MDPDPDPAIFVINLQDAPKKYFIFYVFCSLLFDGTFTSFFYAIKSHKTVGIKVFLTIFV
jgi:hypothetical protein